jgi:transposase-like protein
VEDSPKTLIAAVEYFADPKVCFEAMLGAKWPDGKICCHKCGGPKVGVVRSRQLLQCNNTVTVDGDEKRCGKQFSVKVGTIFEDSPLPLQQWFVAIWCVANAKNGISSCELARALGVRQPTAWFMLHRIRLAMRTGTFRKLTGTVEADETFVGGKGKNMHNGEREQRIRGRGAVGKAIVAGLLERDGEVRAKCVGSVDDQTLMANVRRNVEAGSHVYTDAAGGYRGLALTHLHRWVDHVSQYVAGQVHTNGLENFWALLKRSLGGTYVAVAPFHLERYVDEQAFRFNQRRLDDSGRFLRVLASVVGKRLTYRQLTAQGDSGFMGIK